MAETITVRATAKRLPDGGFPVVLYESHEDHPAGEAYIATDEPVEVGRTARVNQLLGDGQLERIDQPASQQQSWSDTGRSQGQESQRQSAQTGDSLGLNSAQRGALAAYGFDSDEKIKEASDQDLMAVEGIGEATVRRIREA